MAKYCPVSGKDDCSKNCVSGFKCKMREERKRAPGMMKPVPEKIEQTEDIWGEWKSIRDLA